MEWEKRDTTCMSVADILALGLWQVPIEMLKTRLGKNILGEMLRSGLTRPATKRNREEAPCSFGSGQGFGSLQYSELLKRRMV